MVSLSNSCSCSHWVLLGGGFDDDNDDQDGGMLMPAYSRSEVWIFWFKLQSLKNFSKLINNIDTTHISLYLPFLSFPLFLGLSWEPLKVEKL